MDRDFNQIVWDDGLRSDLRELLALAIREDSGRDGDLTTAALIPESAMGRADVAARQEGVIAGLPAAEMALDTFDTRLQWQPNCEDGRPVAPGERIARIEGPARSMLTAERTVLNLLGRLSGIATLTKRYVEAVAGTQARIYDTRKTTPGWRELEKYAVRVGGGKNHRKGLYDAVLIKDNHLAVLAKAEGADPISALGQELERVRPFLGRNVFIELEVDSLEQFEIALQLPVDIILLDNMDIERLSSAVRMRSEAGLAGQIKLEASGGITIDNVRQVAGTGVERISVGTLTHSAEAADIALDIEID